MSLGRSFTALTGANAISMATQLVRGKLAALILGTAGVGVFNQLSVLWNLFNVAGGLGSFVGVVQHGAEARAKGDDAALRRLSSTFLLLLGLVSCSLALLGVLFSSQISDWLLHDGGRHADLVVLTLLSVPLAVTAQTYHALLAATRAVRALVITQVVTDLGATLIFAALIFPFGLRGAVAGFIATYLITLVARAVAVRRLLGPQLLWPSPREFSWAVVRTNVAFGTSGLVMIAANNLAVMLVSRIIIGQLGIGANGIFSNAWRIASVYLGSVTATGFAYLIPTLSHCKTNEELSAEVNSALRFYLCVLPLPMAAVMATGELVVWLILSREFLPVAGLLLLFLPAELLRIMSETIAMTLLARRRMGWYTVLAMAQFALFFAAAAALVPTMGLKGAALAYFIGCSMAVVVNLLVVRWHYGLTLQWPVRRLMLAVALLMGSVAVLSSDVDFGPIRILLAGLLCVLWTAFVLLDPVARGLASKVFPGIFRGAADDR